ncbi:MAG TPA: hypothetical protein VFB75_05340 [Burkholderiales bacterium]|nr:hypothetical protein [Burkholderiales bacterium]
MPQWFRILAPAAVPEPCSSALNAAIVKALHSPQAKALRREAGIALPVPHTPR